MYDVSLESCSDYLPQRVEKAIEKCVNRLGGFKRFVKPGDRVLLEVNALDPCPPESAVCTHPEVLRAVIRLVRDAGGEPFVGDSSGSRAVTRREQNRQNRQSFKVSGMADVAKDEDVEVLMLEKNVIITPNPDGITFKAFPIGSDVQEADVIINLPRLKAHMLTGLTGAVKNLYGTVPGLRKFQYHNTALKAGIDTFADMLIDLNLLVKPQLSILDAVVTLEGVGPIIGEPRRLGWLAASDDTFALDFFAVNMLGVEPDGVHTVRRAVQHGIGPDKMEQIRVSGAPMKELAVSDFENKRPPPPRGSNVGKLTFIRRRTRHNYLTKHFSIRPHAGKGCDACGDCVGACPVNVVRVSDGSVELGGDGCIRCYSCAYACPRDAIYEKPSFFSRGLA